MNDCPYITDWNMIEKSLSVAPIAIFLVQSDGTIRWCAGDSLAMYGYDSDTLKGMKIFDALKNFPSIIQAYKDVNDGIERDLIHSENGEVMLSKFRKVDSEEISACVTTIDVSALNELPTEIQSALRKLRKGKKNRAS
jgi:hypothetical protein